MRSWRPVHKLELVLLVAGIGCLGWFGWNWLATEVHQRWSSYQLDREIRGEKPSLGDFITGSVDPPETRERAPQAKAGTGTDGKAKKQDKTEPPKKSAGYLKTGDMIGRVEIPRLKIKAVVRYGIDDRTLKRAVGFVPGTALPGQQGNVGIAAHRDTHFRKLRGVKQGDTIRFVTKFGAYEYKVDSTDIVLPKNTEVLNPTPEPALTLVTCYPFDYVGSAPKRFIVRATQVQSRPGPPQRETRQQQRLLTSPDFTPSARRRDPVAASCAAASGTLSPNCARSTSPRLPALYR